jgi:hypothetical protein
MAKYESCDEFISVDDIDYRVKYTYIAPFRKFSSDPRDEDEFADFQFFIGEYDVTNIISRSTEKTLIEQIVNEHYGNF